jgi:RNA ligase
MEINLETLVKYRDDGWLLSQNHPTLPLIIWNYSQTTQYENYWDEITLMCRGLVTNNEGDIIARPFKKFFNIEEGKHTPTENFEVWEKMDGSLGIVFWYEGQWIVATRGSFTSDQAIKGAELLKKYNTDIMSKHLTYCFEIVFPQNRVVVDYGDYEGLVLLATFDTSGKEYDIEMWREYGFDVVKKYDGIKDFKELKSIIKENQEGFVVKFDNGDRMKIKGVEYLRLHKIMTNLSTTSVWESLKNDDDIYELLRDVPDEFYEKINDYIVELKNQFKSIQTLYFSYFLDITNKVVSTDRKLFAEFAKKYEHPSLLFSLLDGKDTSEKIWNIIRPEFRKL